MCCGWPIAFFFLPEFVTMMTSKWSEWCPVSGAKKMLIPTKTEPAFLLPILTLLELEMKVAKLERSLIQFDVFKWLYDKWIQGMQVFCVNFCKIFPVLQFDVVLLIIFNCEIVSVNLGVDFVPSSCLKTKYFVLPLFFCSYSYLFELCWCHGRPFPVMPIWGNILFLVCWE